ncbi:MAG TPA: hypothetical protein DCO72_03450 [Ruminococcus sp.]|nr:hypothetical protein [Ruminococcus sp.]
MKRKKRVIAFVSALLILMYGTVPSFSAFADAEEDVLTEELLVSVPVEEATTENAIETPDTETPPVEEETFFSDTVEEDLTDPIEENRELVAENLPAVVSEGGLIDGYQDSYDYVETPPRWEEPTIETPTQTSTTSNVLDRATLYVPYSYLLTLFNAPDNVPATEPDTTEPATTKPDTTEPDTTKPVNLDENIPIPSNLEIVNKGSEGIFTTNYFSDDSLVIDGILDKVGNDVTIPNVVNGHPVRAVRVLTDTDFLSYLWKDVKQITVPSGVAFFTEERQDGYETISVSEAMRLFENVGITLIIDDSNSVSSNNNYQDWNSSSPIYRQKLEDHNGYNMRDLTGYQSDMTTTTVIKGRLPEGLKFYPESTEIYGIPLESGTFNFTLEDLYRNGIYVSGEENTHLPEEYDYLYDMEFELTVLPNSNSNVYNQTDEGYTILQSVGVNQGDYDFVLDPVEDTIFRSEGEFVEFVNLWLNGQLLERGVDYDAESGSTVMTIYAKTFENKAKANSVNTIAAEFRTTDPNSLNTINDTNGLRVTAQNFRFTSDSITSSPKEENISENSKPSDVVSTANVSNNTSTPSVSSSNNNVSTPSSKSDASSTISNNANTADHTPILLYIIICALSMFGVGFSFPHKDKY